MITTRIQLDTKQWEKALTALQTRQLPFARSLAIGRLGDAFQKAERERMQSVFTLRRPEFILREGVKRIGPAPTKNNPTVTFGVSERADFLRKFETGVPKKPTRGAGHTLAVPQQVRRNKRDIITVGNRPRALVERFGQKKGAGQVFVLRQKRGTLGPAVFQRTGRKGRGALKFLYSLTPQVKTPEVLGFLDTAKRVATEQWPSIFAEAFAFALRTAR
jgi:hypothetical protein